MFEQNVEHCQERQQLPARDQNLDLKTLQVKGAHTCHKVDPRQILATIFPAVPAADSVADFHNSVCSYLLKPISVGSEPCHLHRGHPDIAIVKVLKSGQ